MQEKKVSVQIGKDRTIEISCGKIANLANGSAVLRQGDTVLLAAVCSKEAKEFSDFLPLQVDYREKYSAAGRFPGGYIKREGRPSEKEILVCRMTDRPVRSLFPEDFYDEIQIYSQLLSFDGVNEPDMLSILGASAALALSDLPFKGPLGAVRVGLVNGEFVANPSFEEIEKSELDLVYAGVPGKVIMIEGEAKECSEKTLADAMIFADGIIKLQVDAQNELASLAGRPKKTPKLHKVPDDLMAAIKEICLPLLDQACFIPEKEKRQNELNRILSEMEEKLKPAFSEKYPSFSQICSAAFHKLVEKKIRSKILDEAKRMDGRGADDLRPISAEIGVLPRVHGSSLFARGETQALVTITLGAGGDAQEIEPVTSGPLKKPFMLHYYFPNYSVGEVGRISGPGRREIGHGNLAERSLKQVMPADYPYTVRCVSDIMASNGSTSMASVCGGSLALMDAGVPIKSAVAGISCGLVYEDDKHVILTDIIGAEDHYGDMDFKVCGTKDGITGFQLDLKVPGIPIALLCSAMEKNLAARTKILGIMNACISEPKPDVSKHAPRIKVITINREKIGALIGPGGSIIRGITEATGAQIDIDDDGKVSIFAVNEESMNKALDAVRNITAEIEVGKIYRATVVGIKDFGAIVEILPGQEALLHISEMANYRVGKVRDICNEGDVVTIKVLGTDDRGKLKISRKAALEELG